MDLPPYAGRLKAGQPGPMMAMSSLAMAWSLLGLVLAVLAVVGGVWVTRTLRGRHHGPRQIRAAEPPGVQEAREALRMRYARGEISREDYLQGKVELEDCDPVARDAR